MVRVKLFHRKKKDFPGHRFLAVVVVVVVVFVEVVFAKIEFCQKFFGST